MIATMAEDIEKIIAPFASPEPFLSAKSQKVFAAMYAINEPAAKTHPPFNDHDVAKMSATLSKKTKIPRGNSQFILRVY